MQTNQPGMRSTSWYIAYTGYLGLILVCLICTYVYIQAFFHMMLRACTYVCQAQIIRRRLPCMYYFRYSDTIFFKVWRRSTACISTSVDMTYCVTIKYNQLLQWCSSSLLAMLPRKKWTSHCNFPWIEGVRLLFFI